MARDVKRGYWCGGLAREEELLSYLAALLLSWLIRSFRVFCRVLIGEWDNVIGEKTRYKRQSSPRPPDFRKEGDPNPDINTHPPYSVITPPCMGVPPGSSPVRPILRARGPPKAAHAPLSASTRLMGVPHEGSPWGSPMGACVSHALP